MPRLPLQAMAPLVSSSDQDSAKRAAAEAALSYLPDEGIVGLGTGSTSKYFIEGVGRLVADGRKFLAVPTSEQSRIQAESLKIPLAPTDGPWDIALTVDGADEVSESLDLIKGGGGAHTREKIVNFSSRKNIIVVDESKLSAKLGEKWSVPIEVLAFAYAATSERLSSFGEPQRRMKNGAALRTDAGNFIIDLACGPIDAPCKLDAMLQAIPGVVETGLFCGRADLVLVASAAGVRKLTRAS